MVHLKQYLIKLKILFHQQQNDEHQMFQLMMIQVNQQENIVIHRLVLYRIKLIRKIDYVILKVFHLLTILNMIMLL
jgi:hypothetical protein